MVKRRLVSVIDDDESVRESLPDLLRSFDFEVRAFSSAGAFLTSDCAEASDCLILDVAMPGMSGPELQQELARRSNPVPIVFITAHSLESISPQVLRRSVVAFLYKPFSETAMLEAVNAALRKT